MTTFPTTLFNGNGPNRLSQPAGAGNVANPNDQQQPGSQAEAGQMTEDDFLKSILPDWNPGQCAWPIYLVQMLPEDLPEVPTGCPKRAHQTYPSTIARDMAAVHNKAASQKAQGGTPEKWAVILKRNRSGYSSILLINPRKGWVPEDEYSQAPADHTFKGTQAAARRYVQLLNGFYTEKQDRWAVLASSVLLREGAIKATDSPEARFNVLTQLGAVLQVGVTYDSALEFSRRHNAINIDGDHRAQIVQSN
ncbi:hypothetical protein Pla110_24440 [Polystyrenella longa]|uniref:Uncharacterized protein n=1 Tax=Polystyrenella longa TaxID=2528007 RepID=A0A518CNA3_9PLAN|nr:hypothetical protein [Polystyrenella longa]QDU80712.1 hypothetical protein Pla110_24440 [Polystyrenella longa]